MLETTVGDEEYLFRGIVPVNWDFDNDRPSSATFKDSLGVSVDRDGGRTDQDCIEKLIERKNFFAICKVLTKDVRDVGAIVKYAPINPQNLFHSEIHDSETSVQLKGKKPNRIRDCSFVVFKR